MWLMHVESVLGLISTREEMAVWSLEFSNHSFTERYFFSDNILEEKYAMN